MLQVYNILINILKFFSPLIIKLRIRKKKEDPIRYKEKFGIPSKKRSKGKLIWFHGSSVGEILSVVPLVEKFEKNENVNQILITSNTLSSSKVLGKFKFKKTVHQFFPIDTKKIITNFIKYWNPSCAIFIESEIWPNTINQVYKCKIPLIMLNGRITNKTFKRWYQINSFAKELFKKFDICICQNNETKKYLKKLGSKKIVKLGNLKFSENPISKRYIKHKYIDDFFKFKKYIFGAFSTHYNEENFCAEVYLELKKKIEKTVIIIIPRHIDRVTEIIKDLESYNLLVHQHSKKKKIRQKTDIYLVDTFGETQSFMSKCSIVFLGGSIINHGGQNPLEAARLGCRIIHGPNISNFFEIYKLLKKFKITRQINSKTKALNTICESFKSNNSLKYKAKKLNNIGKIVLNKNYNEIKKFI